MTALIRMAEARQDSMVRRLVVAELQPVSGAQARLVVAREAVDSIPQGHELSRRDGRATASLGRGPDGTVVVTATCDSLSRQLMLYEEAYAMLSDRYEQLSDSLRTTYEARTQEERKRTKPPEWLWALAGLAAGAALAKLKTKN